MADGSKESVGLQILKSPSSLHIADIAIVFEVAQAESAASRSRAVSVQGWLDDVKSAPVKDMKHSVAVLNG